MFPNEAYRLADQVMLQVFTVVEIEIVVFAVWHHVAWQEGTNIETTQSMVALCSSDTVLSYQTIRCHNKIIVLIFIALNTSNLTAL
jgi:hypothetical protein